MLRLVNVKLSRDLTYIFNVMNSTDQQSLISRQLNITSFEDFEYRLKDDLKHFYHCFRMIQNEKNENIGFVYSYNNRVNDGNCEIVSYIEKEYQHTGAGVMATITFIDYLFKTMPLRKIYTHVYGYNEESIRSNRDAGLVEEGVLKEYHYLNGKYWDMHIFSIAREAFYEKYQKYL